MRFITYRLLSIILFFSAASDLVAQKEGALLAFTEVTVIPMDKQRVLTNQTVLIQGDKILEIGNSGTVKIPASAKVVASKGMYLMPGLTDMHAHLPTGAADEIGLTDYLEMNVLRGVTTIRSMRGAHSHLALRDSINSGQKIGPSLILGSPVLPQDKDLDPDKARTLIRQYKQEHYDFVKYLYSLHPALYDSVMQIAKQEQIRVAGHCPKAGLEAALNAGQASVEHLDPFLNAYKSDSVKFRKTVNKMGKAEIFACPDLQWYYVTWFQLTLEQLDAHPGMKCLPPSLVNTWDSLYKDEYKENMKKKQDFIKQRMDHRKDLEMTLRMMKSMQEEGIPMLLSPGDGPFLLPGYSLLDECRNFVEAGISPYETLKAGTVNAAAFAQASSSWGVVEAGKKADLLLLGANPLDNIDNLDKINGVMTRGIWYSKEDLERMETEMKDRYNRQK